MDSAGWGKAVPAGTCTTKAMNRPLGGALRAAARPWLIPAGKYIPADRPQRSTPPRRGTPPRLVREVAALYGGVAVLFGWSVSHGGSSGRPLWLVPWPNIRLIDIDN